MNEIFKLYRQTRQKNLSKPGNSKPNQATFGTKRLRAYDIRSYHYQMLGWKSLHLQSMRTYDSRQQTLTKNNT